jgi:hypothetical protein
MTESPLRFYSHHPSPVWLGKRVLLPVDLELRLAFGHRVKQSPSARDCRRCWYPRRLNKVPLMMDRAAAGVRSAHGRGAAGAAAGLAEQPRELRLVRRPLRPCRLPV